MKNQRSNRRDFLKGRSLVQAARQAVENFEFSVPDLDIEVAETRQAAYLESYEKSAMACHWELMFNMHQYRTSGLASSKAMQLIDGLESQLTVYDDDSEVSNLNRNAFETAIKVEPNLFELLFLAKQIFEDTNGAFDITAGQLTSLWGFEQRQGGIPEKDNLAEVLQTTGCEHIQLDHENETVRFLIDGLKINLGGIGKGYAIDRVGELIREHEIDDFLIHGGQSSVLAGGNQKRLETDGENSGWPVGLSHPSLPDRRLAEFFLADAALGTSGTARQGFFHNGKRYGHIIHPKTGWPTDHFLSTTVISPSAAVSDALATAFFVMPIEEVEAFCRQRTEIAAVLVSATQGKSEASVQLDWFNLDDDQWRRL
jgi:thiamine biosynthesis lipoprotein